MYKYNLFRFATQELSHAAFWAWIFQTLDAQDGTFEGPQEVAQRALSRLGVSSPTGSVHVDTEVSLANGCRPDIEVAFSEGKKLYIECKRFGTASPSQIRRYQEQTDNKTRVAMISASFDVSRVSSLCPYLGANEIAEVIGPSRHDHPLLSDYADWVEKVRKRRVQVRDDALSKDLERLRSALSKPVGQWQVMAMITEEMPGVQYRGTNQGGSPWTQFRFCDGGRWDGLFYRIDRYKRGYYFSLRQYLWPDASGWNGKEERLHWLREIWDKASEVARHDLTFERPHNQGTKECEVACLLFKRNELNSIIEDVTAIHQHFVNRLSQSGWPVHT